MSVVHDVPPRKRKRSSLDAGEVDNTPHISSKRQRVGENTGEARHAARDRFWDTLSQVWLTPRALREFDRRNAVREREQTYTTAVGLWPCNRSPIDISQLTATSLKNLKRFARRGGPSLTDLRNVSRAMNYGKGKGLCESFVSVQNHRIRPPRRWALVDPAPRGRSGRASRAN